MDLFPDIFAAKRFARGTTNAVDVGAAIAKILYGGVGTYVTALWTPSSGGGILTPGDIVVGSALIRYNPGGSYSGGLNSDTTNVYIAIIAGNTTTLSLTGTWRAMTYAGGPGSSTSSGYLALFVRIA